MSNNNKVKNKKQKRVIGALSNKLTEFYPHALKDRKQEPPAPWTRPFHKNNAQP